jgi:serine/threonine protein kinase
VYFSLLIPSLLFLRDFCTKTFELLTGTWLFDPQSSDGAGTEDDSGDEGFDDEMDNAASGGELGARSSDGPWSRKDDHLAKMLQITGEVFPSNMISSTPLRRKYFDASGKHLLRMRPHHYILFFYYYFTTGNLRRRKQLPSVTIEDLLRQHGVESQGAADFIRECLHLDPDQRKSAHELASHPWMANAEWCGPELP